MNEQRAKHERRLLGGIAVVLGFGWLLIVMAPLPGMPAERIFSGIWLGTMYGQATLAAIWTCLGSVRLTRRLQMSLAVLGGIIVALVVLMIRLPGLAGESVVLCASMLLQWMLVQIPLWTLVWWSGSRLGHVSLASGPGRKTSGQFGIRQLMIFTAIVAVLLGLGRAIVLLIDWQAILPTPLKEEVPVFAFIVLVNTLFVLPLALATVLSRWSLPAWLIGLALLVGATMVEVPVTQMLLPGTPSGLTTLFWSLNLAQAAWVTGILGILRLGGYRLAAGAESETPHSGSESHTKAGLQQSSLAAMSGEEQTS